MKIFRSRKAIQKWRNSLKPKALVGFVPTMGALHLGHLSLVRRARRECDQMIASIFVNPTQFAPHEDFRKYPRQEEADLKLLEAAGVDAVFLPTVDEIYATDFETKILPRESLANVLEGAFRPGHFEGVATVVMKLFQIVNPSIAYFGEKDFQQVRVIEAMVEDFFLDLKIRRCKTLREKSGLAMSSRNAYLSQTEREKAAEIYKQLTSAQSPRDAISHLKQALFEVQYLEVWTPNLERRASGVSGRWLVAAKFHGVRLIDNVLRS